MADFLQLILSGASYGAIYGLFGVGYVAIFSVNKVINMAQGEFGIAAAVVSISLVSAGWPVPLALIAGILAGVLIACLLQIVVLSPVKNLSMLTSVILTLGASAVIKSVLLLWVGPGAKSLPVLPGADVQILGATIRSQELWIFGSTVIVAAFLTWFYDRTLTGKALRASSQQPTAARLVGISVKRAAIVAFAIAGGTAALAGILSSPLHFTVWDSGLVLGLKGFVAAAIAGMVSIRAAIGGGILLGIVESLVAGYLDSGYRDGVAFLILIAVLILRPQGLFSRQMEERV